jgi:hypothetical protein
MRFLLFFPKTAHCRSSTFHCWDFGVYSLSSAGECNGYKGRSGNSVTYRFP